MRLKAWGTTTTVSVWTKRSSVVVTGWPSFITVTGTVRLVARAPWAQILVAWSRTTPSTRMPSIHATRWAKIQWLSAPGSLGGFMGREMAEWADAFKGKGGE